MLSPEYLEKIKKMDIGRREMDTDDARSIWDFAGDSRFDMVWTAYKLGFVRGRRAGKREVLHHGQ